MNIFSQHWQAKGPATTYAYPDDKHRTLEREKIVDEFMRVVENRQQVEIDLLSYAITASATELFKGYWSCGTNIPRPKDRYHYNHATGEFVKVK